MVLAQERRRTRVEVEGDVVLELNHADGVGAGRHAHDAAAGGRADIDSALEGVGRVVRPLSGGAGGPHVERAGGRRGLSRADAASAEQRPRANRRTARQQEVTSSADGNERAARTVMMLPRMAVDLIANAVRCGCRHP